MAQVLFSESLEVFSGSLDNQHLQQSLESLALYLRKRLKLLKWDDEHVAIPLSVAVELPPLGNYDGIDIRSTEQILLVLSLKHYPYEAPKVYPDRLDFPKNKLAHLYIARDGRPPAFCFIRGDRDDWYASKQIKDLVVRIANWLRDAAAGVLSEDGDQFDPLRLEGYSGTVVYDYDAFCDTVVNKKSFVVNSNFAIAQFKRDIADDVFVFSFKRFVTAANLEETLDEFKKENAKDKSDATKKAYHFGYVVWAEPEETVTDYDVSLPRTWEALKVYCQEKGISCDALEAYITAEDPNIYVHFPLIVGIKRPKKIIGFSGEFEFVNFFVRIDSPDIVDGKISDSVPVKFQKHSQVLTTNKAKEISGEDIDTGLISLVLGAGALGSKIVLHLARAGTTGFIICDPDILSPHNLVRHSLFSSHIGHFKAAALSREIHGIFPGEGVLAFPALKKGQEMLTPQLTAGFSYIFDFSVSASLFNSLVTAQLSEKNRVIKAFLADAGNLGIIFFEGNARTPRIDDLQVFLYWKSGELEFISDWLRREQQDENKTVDLKVGVGCNSETTILSDYMVSLHAAYFTGVISQENKSPRLGRIFISRVTHAPFFSNQTYQIEVPEFSVMHTVNKSGWQIRIQTHLLDTLRNEMEKMRPNETGGAFIGCANHKTKVVHIVDVILAPDDSHANHVCFFRGINGLPETINRINDQTGHQIGYIGEWHSHPDGPNGMSATDMSSVRRFKKEFDQLASPIPTVLVIVTPDGILPFIY